MTDQPTAALIRSRYAGRTTVACPDGSVEPDPLYEGWVEARNDALDARYDELVAVAHAEAAAG